MRLAFVDLVFTWPPLGGAPLDLYYTMSGLQALGHEVHLFYGESPENWWLDPADESALPFSATRLLFSREDTREEVYAQRYREAVDAWKPDVVFQCFGFFMKPVVTLALAHYPQIARYYAYEPFCPRDYRLLLESGTCPNNYLRTPSACNRCAFNAFRPGLRLGKAAGYVLEYERMRGWSQDYYRKLIDSIRMYKAIIVYNHFTKRMLEGFNGNVHVIGGGVHIEDFFYDPLPEQGRGGKTAILMAGRANDPSKGLKILKEAGEILARERNDFEIWATCSDPAIETDWLKTLGWHDFAKVMEFYRRADICVTPSVWEEPFGLVAVEAMATGRPVVASDVGGLQEIVVHGETGYVYRRKNAAELAQYLGNLLDDAPLRKRMGDAGRHRAEEIYDWKAVIQRHYPPMLEQVLQ